jgi:hypothetical protein
MPFGPMICQEPDVFYDRFPVRAGKGCWVSPHFAVSGRQEPNTGREPTYNARISSAVNLVVSGPLPFAWTIA